MIQKRIYLLAFLLPFLFLACKKERVVANWEEIATPYTYDFTDIHFVNNSKGWATLGTAWDYGGILSTNDGGNTWQLDSLQSYQISGLDADISKQLHLGGYVGYYARQQPMGWNEQILPSYWHHKDVASYDGSRVILVSGEAFNSGQITVLDGWNNIISLDTFDHDYSAVAFADANHATVAGYGQLLHSSNAGESWKILPVTGDWFTDVQFPTTTTGYICGFSGSILKSTDAGKTWIFLRQGDRLTVKDKRFTALHFEDEWHGYLVGNNGLCWRTVDGGATWMILRGLPDYNFTAVFVLKDFAILVAKGGKIIRVRH